MKFICISMILLICQFITIGQDSISKNIDTPKRNIIQQPKAIENNKETEAYKLLYETNKESSEKTLTANKTELQKEFLALKADLKKHEAEIWLLKGVNQNALSYFIKATEFKVELGEEIKYILGDIVTILKKIDDIH